MDNDSTHPDLERMIAKAGSQRPPVRSSLKLEVLRAARKQVAQRWARRQLLAVAGICLAFGLLTEWRFQAAFSNSVAGPEMTLAVIDTRDLKPFALDPAGIGSWEHVDAVMRYRLQMNFVLGHVQ